MRSVTNLLTLQQVELRGKRVLLREDLNVPLHCQEITNDARIIAAIPTIEYALQKKARVVVLSHLGRPNAGDRNPEFSLAPVAAYLQKKLGRIVTLKDNWLEEDPFPAAGEVVIAENVRFEPGETDNDEELAKRIAAMCDVYVMDAFGAAHRAHASTEGVARFAKTAVAGPLLVKELSAIAQVLEAPEKPVVGIVGGAKVSTKLELLSELLKKVDTLIVGGGMANTFLSAKGYEIGASLYEPELIETAKNLLQLAEQWGKQILMPVDVIVGTELHERAQGQEKSLDAICKEDKIFDIGTKTIMQYKAVLEKAATILWNGPVGVFEYPAFAAGTHALAILIAESHAFSLAGGGDTLSAISQFGVWDDISYISTGGAAFLAMMEGKELPSVKILAERAKT